MGVGMSTKETTLHHFRDPLVELLGNDKEIDFLGILVLGTPQDFETKMMVGTRAAAWAEALRAEGVIVTVNGIGNDHVDYANTIEQLGRRGIPTVGLSFIGDQPFVVVNQYMDTILDLDKSQIGFGSDRVGENTVIKLDARKALAFLKLKMRRAKDSM